MGRFGHRFQLLVVDEVHHFGCDLRDEALEMSIAPAGLGLTATPQASRLTRRRGSPSTPDPMVGRLAAEHQRSRSSLA